MKNTLLKILSAFFVLLTIWFIQANAHLADALPAFTQEGFSTEDDLISAPEITEYDLFITDHLSASEHLDLELFEDETEERHRNLRNWLVQLLVTAPVISAAVLGYLFMPLKRVNPLGQYLTFSPVSSRTIRFQVFRL